MTVNYATPAPDKLYPVAGLRLGVAEAGIRKLNRRDLTLLEVSPGATVAGVFTRNPMPALIAGRILRGARL